MPKDTPPLRPRSCQLKVTVSRRDSLVFDKKKNVYRVVTGRQKTGTHVSVLIPADVAKELLSVANANASTCFGIIEVGKRKPR